MQTLKEKLTDVFDVLEGRKTYLLAAIGLAYLFGGSIGWWTVDDRIIELLGFGGLVAIRAVVKKTTP